MARIPSGTIPIASPDMFDASATMSVTIPVTEELVEWWDMHLLQPHKLTPQAVADILLRDLQRNERVVFYRFDASGTENFIQISIEGREGVHTVYLAGHSLFLTTVEARGVSDPHIEIDVLDVVPEHQGQGISAAIMANTYDLAAALDINIMTVEAYLAGGPYAWPRYGFMPLRKYWPAVKRKMEDKLLELGSQVPEVVRERLRPILLATEPRAIFALLDERMPVNSRGADGVIRKVPLARALLADSDQRWYGVMNLDDRASKSLFFDCIARNKK